MMLSLQKILLQSPNYIYTEINSRIAEFESYLKNAIEVGECYRNNSNVYGGNLKGQDDGTIIASHQEKLENLATVDLSTPDKFGRSGNHVGSADELNKFRRAIGMALFVGRRSDPYLLRISSTMATKLTN